MKHLLLKARKEADVQIVDEAHGPLKVRIRELTIADAAELEKMQANEKKDDVAISVKMVISSVVDEKGEPLFTDEDSNQITSLMSLSTLKAITDAARKLNRFDDPAAASEPAQKKE